MKSVTIYDAKGEVMFKFLRDKKGVVATVGIDLEPFTSAKVKLNDGSIIKFPRGNKRVVKPC